MPLTGTRFKSLTRPDFDLCEFCKAEDHTQDEWRTISPPGMQNAPPPRAQSVGRCPRRRCAPSRRHNPVGDLLTALSGLGVREPQQSDPQQQQEQQQEQPKTEQPPTDEAMAEAVPRLPSDEEQAKYVAALGEIGFVDKEWAREALAENNWDVERAAQELIRARE